MTEMSFFVNCDSSSYLNETVHDGLSLIGTVLFNYFLMSKYESMLFLYFQVSVSSW